MTGPIVPISLIFLACSVGVATVATYYQNKYSEKSTESYPILSLDADSSHLASFIIQNDPLNKKKIFKIYSNQGNLLYIIERNDTLKDVWFLKDNSNSQKLWTVKVAHFPKLFYQSKEKISFAISNNNDGTIGSKIIKYQNDNAKFNSFQVFHNSSSSNDNDVTYRWLYKSRYLEKTDIDYRDPLTDKPIHKRIALIINMDDRKTNNLFDSRSYKYLSIYNFNEINIEEAAISTFLSILNQWKYSSNYDKNLKFKAERWISNNCQRPENVEEGIIVNEPIEESQPINHEQNNTKIKPSKYSTRTEIKRQESVNFQSTSHHKTELKNRMKLSKSKILDRTV